MSRGLDRVQSPVPAFAVRVCRGAQQCAHAVQSGNDPTEALAAQVEASGWPEFVTSRVHPLRHHHQFRIAYAACPNGCSQPHIADLGLIATARLAVRPELCSACGACVSACAENALSVDEGVRLDSARCLGCASCARVCPTEALAVAEVRYRVLLGGKLGRHPRLAQELGRYSFSDVLLVLHRTLELLMAHYRPGLRLGELVELLGPEHVMAQVRP